MSKTQVIPYSEVIKHNTDKDCWLIINRNVYDVTKFVPFHPGGKLIATLAGKDATDAFDAFHAQGPAIPKLKHYQIGVLGDDAPPLSPMLADYRKLRQDFEDEGQFEASFAWFMMIFAIYAGIYIFGFALLFLLPHSWITSILSGMCLGVLIC